MDVERVRFAGEWTARRGDAVHKGHPIAPAPFLREHTIRLSPSVAPELHALLAVAKERLGVTVDVEIHQTTRWTTERYTCQLFRPTRESARILFHGDYLLSLDEGGVLAVLGHELGHYVAGHWDEPRDEAASRGAELTADRLALLACRDLDAVIRLEMSSTAGFRVPAEWNARAFLADCRDQVRRMLAQREAAARGTHPILPVRVYAIAAFADTDVYRELTGEGDGSVSLRALDEELASLLGARLPGSRRAAVRPAPSSRAPGPLSLADLPDHVADATDAVKRTFGEVLDRVARRSSAAKGAPRHDDRDDAEVDDAEVEAALRELEARRRGVDEDAEKRALLERFAELERRAKGSV